MPGTPGVEDHEDVHELSTELADLLFEKTVANVTASVDPATTATPGDVLRYRLRVENVSSIPVPEFDVVDEHGAVVGNGFRLRQRACLRKPALRDHIGGSCLCQPDRLSHHPCRRLLGHADLFRAAFALHLERALPDDARTGACAAQTGLKSCLGRLPSASKINPAWY